MTKIILPIIFTFIFASNIFSQISSFTVNSSNSEFCLGDTVIFSNNSTSYSYCLWNFGDSYETFVENPKHVFLFSGNYNIKLIVYNEFGNSDTTSANIIINENPQLNLIPGNDTTLIIGNSLLITAQGNFDNILWSTQETSNEITVTNAGQYFCNVSNIANSCSNSDTINVYFVENPNFIDVSSLIVNNILTPNNDGINDFLFINEIENFENPVELFIYNKTGTLIFSDSNYQNNWNGFSNSGNILPTGTYYIIIKIKDKQGITGFVDIIR